MTLKECYQELEGDYEGVLSRLSSEALVKKFALKFLAEESFHKLEKAMEDKDCKEAFNAAHTLKGVSANLSFTKLSRAASDITEQLRGGELCEECYLDFVREVYQQTIAALEKLQAEQ